MYVDRVLLVNDLLVVELPSKPLDPNGIIPGMSHYLFYSSQLTSIQEFQNLTIAHSRYSRADGLGYRNLPGANVFARGL